MRDLFQAFDLDPHRAVAEDVAGLTHRYANREHRRIFDIEELA